jgi:hypothetical protein
LIGASHLRRQLIANAMVACALLFCSALFLDPPGAAGFWPACPIHQLFGIDCPGCGATRALGSLMHGHLREALRFNALFVLLLPFASTGAALCYRRALEPGSFRWPNPPRFATYAACAIALVFTVARNLPH